MSPRPDVSEERRAQILTAAAEVFARLGFARARMDDIVIATGLSKGALYWYFKSKDEVVLALLNGYFGPALSNLRLVLTTAAPAGERLLLLTRQLATVVTETSNLLPLAYEFYAAANHHDTIRAYLKDYFTQYRELLADLVRQGVVQGEFYAVDPLTVAISVEAMYEGLTLLWLLDREATDLGKLAESSVQLILKAIKIGGVGV